MYRRSLYLRVIGDSYVVLAFCLFLVNYVVLVGGASLSENTKDTETLQNVLPNAETKNTAASTEIANSTDVSSVDTSADKAPEIIGSAHANTTVMYAGSPPWFTSIKSGALERTGFVALGIMSVILFFFIIRAIRIRRKRSKSRKYGVITSTASDMEMEPLDRGDDDEEETTLFDAQHHKYNLK